jgi:hypothetical protein
MDFPAAFLTDTQAPHCAAVEYKFKPSAVPKTPAGRVYPSKEQAPTAPAYQVAIPEVDLSAMTEP